MQTVKELAKVELIRISEDKHFSEYGYAAVYAKNGNVFSTDDAKDTVGCEIIHETMDFRGEWYDAFFEEEEVACLKTANYRNFWKMGVDILDVIDIQILGKFYMRGKWGMAAPHAEDNSGFIFYRKDESKICLSYKDSDNFTIYEIDKKGNSIYVKALLWGEDVTEDVIKHNGWVSKKQELHCVAFDHNNDSHRCEYNYTGYAGNPFRELTRIVKMLNLRGCLRTPLLTCYPYLQNGCVAYIDEKLVKSNKGVEEETITLYKHRGAIEELFKVRVLKSTQHFMGLATVKNRKEVHAYVYVNEVLTVLVFDEDFNYISNVKYDETFDENVTELIVIDTDTAKYDDMYNDVKQSDTVLAEAFKACYDSF
jgi:hypothetical protein